MEQLVHPNKVCFIIAHKYFRGYPSYLKLYTERIFEYYPEALVIVVDNNSTYKDEVFETIDSRLNVVFLDNNIQSKFELGAYQVGLHYLIANQLIHKYSYINFTQDNFILNKGLDYKALRDLNIKACPINSYYPDGACREVWYPVLENLGMNNNLDKITFCWCSSFIIDSVHAEELYRILKTIVQQTRLDSEGAERYLARILWELNGYSNFDLDGDIRDLKEKYDCWTVDPYHDNVDSFFTKVVQQKNENTVDKY
jgi:hypothetical protein